MGSIWSFHTGTNISKRLDERNKRRPHFSPQVTFRRLCWKGAIMSWVMTGLESITRVRASSRQCLTSVNFLILINYCRPAEVRMFTSNNFKPVVFNRRIVPLCSVERNLITDYKPFQYKSGFSWHRPMYFFLIEDAHFGKYERYPESKYL